MVTVKLSQFQRWPWFWAPSLWPCCKALHLWPWNRTLQYSLIFIPAPPSHGAGGGGGDFCPYLTLKGNVMASVHNGCFLSTRLILLWKHNELKVTFKHQRFLPFPTFLYLPPEHLFLKICGFLSVWRSLPFFAHGPLLFTQCEVFYYPISAHI